MQTLSQSEHKGTTQALDEAVSAYSGGKYETWADFIKCFKNDVNGIIRNLEWVFETDGNGVADENSIKDFLKNYCDIYLDTGTEEITGANARGYFGDDADPTEYNKYVKNAEDIVSEDSSKEFAYLDFQENDCWYIYKEIKKNEGFYCEISWA